MRIALLFIIITGARLTAQVNYTANDQVTPYNGPFGFGANMGWYNGWTDDQLADIAVGNSSLGLEGIGVNSLRPLLPEYFLEEWGYEIRTSTFQHYSNLGASENVAIIGYSSEIHREPTQFCPGAPAETFANLYLPIWDDGANGTPVNDENYYALYLYKMVSAYKGHIRFYEVLNEPDFDYSGNGWKDASYPDSWFNNVPNPCDYAFKAPIPYYVRMLRISYEVIKTVDPSAYVAIGGLGYPSFLDMVLRFTDNPNNGTVDGTYPLKGGAYFDVLSYHSYPHIDGSMRNYSENGFVYERNSDKAVDGVFARQTAFQEVLSDYGYNGNTYPEKEWIITESNIPREGFSYFGSNEAQRNFLIKALTLCPQNKIHQFHVYTMSDTGNPGEAWEEFQTMGLFQSLSAAGPYNQVGNDAALAYKTTSELLGGMEYSAERTAMMNLSSTIRGAAYYDRNEGKYSYVLWAKASQDMTEIASANYSFPADLQSEELVLQHWDFARTNESIQTNGQNLELGGTPIFITDGKVTEAEETYEEKILDIFPNPATSNINVRISLTEATSVNLALYDGLGRKIRSYLNDQVLNAGENQLAFSTTLNRSGIYFIKLLANDVETIRKVIIFND